MEDWAWMSWVTGAVISLTGLWAGYFLARRQFRREQDEQDPGEHWVRGFHDGLKYGLKEAEEALWVYSMRLREQQGYSGRSQDWLLGFEFACATLSSYVEKKTKEEDDDTPALEDQPT